MEKKPVYKVNVEKKESDFRGERLTVRLTADDRRMLDDLRVKFSPYAPLSLGKALSVAIRLAGESVASK